MIYQTFSSLSSQLNFHPATLYINNKLRMFTSAIGQLGPLQVIKLNTPIAHSTGTRTIILKTT